MINTRFVRNVCFATTLTPNSFKLKNIDKLFSSCLNTLYNLKKMADNVCKMKPVVMRRNMHNKIICSTSVILELVLYHFYTFIEIMLQNITSLKLSKYFNSKLGNCRKNFKLFLNWYFSGWISKISSWVSQKTSITFVWMTNSLFLVGLRFQQYVAQILDSIVRNKYIWWIK